jgi:hypothetical protein
VLSLDSLSALASLPAAFNLDRMYTVLAGRHAKEEEAPASASMSAAEVDKVLASLNISIAGGNALTTAFLAAVARSSGGATPPAAQAPAAQPQGRRLQQSGQVTASLKLQVVIHLMSHEITDADGYK